MALAVELGTGEYSVRFLESVDAALSFLPEKRPQNVMQWPAMFPSGPGATSTSGPVVESVSKADEKPQSEAIVGDSSSIVQNESATPAPSQIGPVEPPPVVSRKPLLGWLLAGALLVVGLGVTGWYVLRGGSDSELVARDSASKSVLSEPLTIPTESGAWVVEATTSRVLEQVDQVESFAADADALDALTKKLDELGNASEATKSEETAELEMSSSETVVTQDATVADAKQQAAELATKQATELAEQQAAARKLAEENRLLKAKRRQREETLRLEEEVRQLGELDRLREAERVEQALQREDVVQQTKDQVDALLEFAEQDLLASRLTTPAG